MITLTNIYTGKHLSEKISELSRTPNSSNFIRFEQTSNQAIYFLDIEPDDHVRIAFEAIETLRINCNFDFDMAVVLSTIDNITKSELTDQTQESDWTGRVTVSSSLVKNFRGNFKFLRGRQAFILTLAEANFGRIAFEDSVVKNAFDIQISNRPSDRPTTIIRTRSGARVVAGCFDGTIRDYVQAFKKCHGATEVRILKNILQCYELWRGSN